MRALWFRARSDLRSGWRSWAGLALVVGLAGGIVLAAAAGARRTESAYGRFTATVHAADFHVYGTPNPDTGKLVPDHVAQLPQVAEYGRMRYYASTASNFTPVASPDQRMHARDGGIDRLKVTEGRSAKPDRVDEATVDFLMAQRDHIHPGRVMNLSFVGADQQSVVLRLTVRVVGVVAAPSRFPPLDAHTYLSDPWVYLTPAFYQSYNDQLVGLDLLAVRVKEGQGPAFENLASVGADGKTIPDEKLADQAKGVQHGFRLQAIALWLLTGLAGLSAVLIVGQLLARQNVLHAADDPVLSALGLTRSQRWGVALLRTTLVAAFGTGTAVGIAILLSPLTPLGTPRLADPHPGFAVDGLVLPLGALMVFALVPILAAWPAWRASRTMTPDAVQDRPSTVSELVTRLGLPPTVTSGVRMALAPGRGRSAVPVRSSVAGVTIALAALAAALTFGTSLQHVLHTPRLYGVGWDADVLNNNGPRAVPVALPVLKADPDVAGVAWEDGAPTRVNGRDVGAQGFDVVSGAGPTVMLAGRAPRAAGEIALGPKTMRDLHMAIGSEVQVQAWSDQAPKRTLKVVGKAVLSPGNGSFGKNSELGVGSVLSEPGLAGLLPPNFERPQPYSLAIRFASGVDPFKARARLTTALRAKDANFDVSIPTTPADITDFGHVVNLPLVLAGLLAAVAAATIAHLLFSSVRRRRRDLALLKTLGFVSRQVRSAVAWQATSLVAAAVLVGLPVGVAAGRVMWGRFAERSGFLPDPAVPILTLLLMVPAALVLANLVAAVPARLAGRVRPAIALRSE